MGTDSDRGAAKAEAGLPSRAKRRLQAEKSGLQQQSLSAEDAHTLVQELVVRQVELEAQNAALREVRAELERALGNCQDHNLTLEERIGQSVQELRKKDRELLQKTRQAVMGEMINNIAHQWRQPLNALGVNIQEAQLRHQSDEFSQEYFRGNVARSLELIKYMSRTIDDFRNFFRLDKEAVIFDVNLMIARTLSLVEKSFQEQNIAIALDPEAGLTVEGYPSEYCQALLNILMNARDASVANAADSALISIRSFSEDGKVAVTVADQGGGIAGEVLNRLFEPYVTTKGPESGTGVGLYMAKTIIENMGGRLLARNAGEGAEFRIEI